MKIELINFLNVSYQTQMETLKWRNSSRVAKYFQIKNIEEETHKKWLEKLKDIKPSTIAFFINCNKRNIGVTYFHSVDYENKQCDWGVYIFYDELRDQGVGTKVLLLCLDYAKHELKMNTIYLEVLSNNQRAMTVYEKVGFQLVKEKDNIRRYMKCL